MRRLIILGLLFALMYVLQFLQVEAETAFSAKSLATVGFILLAAYTLGEITSRFGLPKITGYIVTGLLFGPHVVDLFSVAVVNDLKIINGLAIGLIALSAGGELKVSSLRKIARSLTLIVVIKGGLILLAVMGAVYAVAALLPQTLPFLAGASAPLVLAVGGLFGVLAIGTSPAVTIAVINETGSRGRLADTTLGVAVFKDVVMVVLLAVFIALTQVFSAPDAAFDAHVFVEVGEELLFSILAGAFLGALVILYLRFIGAEMWLFLIAVIFSMTALADLFHLEVLLTFITAGFVVQNFSKLGDDFVHQIESVALPVYVVFFSVAGAGLDLSALMQVGLVAGVLVVVRLLAIFAGTGLATRLAREPEAIRQNAWLSFISQAGVVIGLTIIIEHNLPALGPGIRTVVLGTIAINLLVGPVLFKVALARTGETREGRPSGVVEAPLSEEEAEAPLPAAPEPPSEIRYPEPAFASPRMTAASLHLQARLVRIQQDFQDQFLVRETGLLGQFFERMRGRYHEMLAVLRQQIREARGDPMRQAHLFRENRTAFSRWLQSEVIAFGTRPDRTRAAQQTFDDFSQAVHDVCRQLEEQFEVIQEPERFQPTPDDSLYVRFRKALKRAGEQVSSLFGSGVRDMRTVPFQRLAYYHLDGLLPAQMVPVANLTGAQSLFVLNKARILHRQIDEQYTAVIDRLQPEEGTPPSLALEEAVCGRMEQEMEADFAQAMDDLARFGEEMEQRLALALVQRYAAFLHDLEGAGTFELPARKRRFSLVYEQSQRAKTEIRHALDVWQAYARGAAGSIAKQLDVLMLADHIARIVDETLVQVSAAIQGKVGVHVETAQAACARSLEQLGETFDANGAAPALHDELVSHQQALIDTLDAETLAPLEELRASRPLNALLDRMLQRFSELAAAVPETYNVIEWDDLPADRQYSATPVEARMKVAPMRQVTRAYLETRLARNLAESNQTLFREVDAAIQALTEVRHLVRFNLQTALDELDAGTPDALDRARELALGGLKRARNRLGRTREQVEQFAGEVNRQIHDSTSRLIPALDGAISGQTEFSLRLQQEQQRVFTRVAASLQQARGEVRHRLRLLSRRLQHRFRPLAEDLRREVRSSLPLGELKPDEVLSRYDQATLDATRIERLPFIYQKLFAFTPLEADEFLVARREEKQMVEGAVRRWASGAPSSVAVTGEPGVGVSSFLHLVRRALQEAHPVHHVTFTQTPSSKEALVRLLARRLRLPGARSFDDLARLIRSGAGTEAGPGRAVVLLEDAHYLYRRAPGGFDLLKGLLLLVATTGDRLFWVLSMNRHAWTYLDAVVGLAEAFAFTITLPALSRDELEKAILVRHRFSGLDLRFVPSALMRQRRRYRRAGEAEQQAMLQAAFFDQLHRLSAGNPLAGLFYWLKAIDEVQEHRLTVRPLERQPFGYVRGLDVDALLTLKAVLQQGALSVEDHAGIFGIGESDSHARLMHLVNLNLLTRHSRTAPVTFRLNGPIYKPLAQELAAMNLLA